MTIQEAIKSRKPFRRNSVESSGNWNFISPTGMIVREIVNERDETFTIIMGHFLAESILATDWEIKE